MLIRLVLASVLPFLLLAHAEQATQRNSTMTNADVIALANAGMSDEIIIAKIQAAPATDFDTAVTGLKALQTAHVSTAVIRVMINPHSSVTGATVKPATTAAASSTNDPDAPHSPGIYLYSISSAGHTLTELQRVTAKQVKGSGAWVSGMTYGLKKYKVKGVLEGANSAIKTADPNPVFYLYAPEANGAFGGSSIKPNDFTLLKLTQKNDTREIVEASGNIWGSTIGADDKEKRGFTVEQITPGVYKLTPLQPLPAGEYAFQQAAGTFFDFRILSPE